MSGDEPEIVRTLREEERLGKLRTEGSSESVVDQVGCGESEEYWSIAVSPAGGSQKPVNVGDPQVLYQTIFENSAVAITLSDGNERVIRWNPYAERLLGRSRAELWMLPVKRLYPAEEWSKIRFQNIRQQGITHHLETRMVRGNGECLDVDLSVSVLKDQLGNVIGSIGIIKDISAAKAMEKALRRSEETFKQLYEKAPVLYHTLSPRGELTNINEQWCHVMGYSKEEVLGKYIFDFIEFTERDQAQRSFDAKIASKQQYSAPTERTYKTKTGEERVFLIQDFLSFDENNAVIAIQTTMVDVTDRKRMEQVLRNQRDELEQCVAERTAELVQKNVQLHEEMQEHEQIETALELTLTHLKESQRRIEEQNIQLKKLDEMKTNFLNITSHELRTPMASIKGFVQAIHERMLGVVSDEQEKALVVILRNVERLDHLIQDILDVSRLESGTMVFSREPIRASDVVTEAIGSVQAAADRKNIMLQMEKNPELPTLIADKTRIIQVLVNLLNNAIKFSPEKTAIRVRTKRDGNDVVFEVEDHGRGIPADKIEKIFETFYQVDAGLDRKFGGIGLGLPIARGIIHAHGGRIWADSATDGGSVLRFTLPVTPPAEGGPMAKGSEATPSGDH